MYSELIESLAKRQGTSSSFLVSECTQSVRLYKYAFVVMWLLAFLAFGIFNHCQAEFPDYKILFIVFSGISILSALFISFLTLKVVVESIINPEKVAISMLEDEQTQYLRTIETLWEK